jgi:ribonuclease HI
VQKSAQRPAEWIAHDQCSEREWALCKGARDRFHAAQQRVQSARVLIQPVAPPNCVSDHPPPQHGQATLHAFGQTAWEQPQEPDQERFIAQNHQSTAAWHPWQRPKQAAMAFDITSMLPRAPCLPQGSWEAISRHGQSVLRVHPRPFQKRMERITVVDEDLAVDSAQLRAVLGQSSSLLHVAEGVERQVAADEREGGWAKSFTSRLGHINGLKYLWGCTALTADPQYQDFVSPYEEDVQLGGVPFEQALDRLGEGSLILLSAFNTEQQKQILDHLATLPTGKWMLISRISNTPQGRAFEASIARSSTRVTEIYQGQRVHAKAKAWRNGDTTPSTGDGDYRVWLEKRHAISPSKWDQCIDEQPLSKLEIGQLTEAGTEYWRARQDGAYFEDEQVTLAACDGSVKGDMGAAAVICPPGAEPIIIHGKVAGAEVGSSYRAEAAAMSFAVQHAPKHIPLVIYTDSMNVIHALQAWNRRIFCRDLSRQRNADILERILSDINARSARTTVVKVKSHRGIPLNEEADVWAGTAAAADSEEVEWYFATDPPDNAMTFTWEFGTAEETTTSDLGKVLKRWNIMAEKATVEKVRQEGTMGGLFLTEEGQGRHLLQKSRTIRPWTAQEERRWMQLVGRVFPVNTYLRRIDKHPTGACPFGCKGPDGQPARETIGHFQSCCPKFAENRTLAHHGIAKAVVGALAGAKIAQWKFYYETPFSKLPFQLQWTDEEREGQEKRRPDGVAWNATTKTALFIEFTRCMDHPHTMRDALERKGTQYDEALAAVARDHRQTPLTQQQVRVARTMPLIFGVRGGIAYAEACKELEVFKLSPAKCDRILACGVREAIRGANEMCNARFAALKTMPGRLRLPNGKRQKVIIPQKPMRPTAWRADRGWGGGGRV